MAEAASGGRTWWAHFEFTRINIEPIILKNKIEERRTVGAFPGLEQGLRTVRRYARPDSTRGGELAAR